MNRIQNMTKRHLNKKKMTIWHIDKVYLFYSQTGFASKPAFWKACSLKTKRGCLKSLLKHLTTEETEIKQSSQRFDTKKVTSLRTL